MVSITQSAVVIARRPRVWMLSPSFYPTIGGTEQQVGLLTQLLVERDWTVRVLTRQHNWAYPTGLPGGDLNVNGTPVTRIFSRARGKLGSLLFLAGGFFHLLRRGRGDIYHAHDVAATGWLAVAARYLLGGRCLIKLRTGRERYEQFYATPLARLRLRALLRLADRVVVVNQAVRDFVADLGVPLANVMLLPNAVDSDHFSPPEPAGRSEVRAQLGLPRDKTLLLWVGRLQRVKGLDILLRAWAHLPPALRGGAMLVLVGDGAERDRLLKLISELGISDSVLLRGRQETVTSYYRAADLFVLPSRSEGQSNALVEAMSCGLPVVASRVGGAADLIRDGENGHLFEPEDHSDLAKQLTMLISEPESWPALGAAGRQTVKEEASLSRAIDRLSEVYELL